MPHGGASERVQMTNPQNKKTIIAHKEMYFHRICNSSDCFSTAKTATLSRTVHVLLSVISSSQVKTIVQISAHVGVEPFATFKVWRAELFLTMAYPGPTFRKAPPWGRRSVEVPNKYRGDVRAWNWSSHYPLEGLVVMWIASWTLRAYSLD